MANVEGRQDRKVTTQKIIVSPKEFIIESIFIGICRSSSRIRHFCFAKNQKNSSKFNYIVYRNSSRITASLNYLFGRNPKKIRFEKPPNWYRKRQKCYYILMNSAY